MINDPAKKEEYRKIAIALLGFAVICFITSLFLNMNVGKTLKAKVPASGGIIGPVEVKKDYSVYEIKVNQYIPTYGTWSFVGGDVLDENKEYLFGFGKEFWKEQGYDSDGSWSEAVTNFDMKVTFPKKGAFYLEFKADMSRPDAGGEISVIMSPKRGSSLAHVILGIISIIACGIVWAKTNMTWGDMLDD